jgi:hypothetical protein
MKRELSEVEIILGRSQNYYQMTSEEQWDEDKRLGILDWDASDVQQTDRLIQKKLEEIFQNTPEGPAKEIMMTQRHNRILFKDIFEKIDEMSELEFPEGEKQGAMKALMFIGNYLLNRPIQ